MIIEALADATAAACPTYVDDLAALVVGPGQLLLLQVCTLALSKAVGLVVNAPLRVLPVDIQVTQRPHPTTTITGINSYTIKAILTHLAPELAQAVTN